MHRARCLVRAPRPSPGQAPVCSSLRLPSGCRRAGQGQAYERARGRTACGHQRRPVESRRRLVVHGPKFETRRAAPQRCRTLSDRTTSSIGPIDAGSALESRSDVRFRAQIFLGTVRPDGRPTSTRQRSQHPSTVGSRGRLGPRSHRRQAQMRACLTSKALTLSAATAPPPSAVPSGG